MKLEKQYKGIKVIINLDEWYSYWMPFEKRLKRNLHLWKSNWTFNSTIDNKVVGTWKKKGVINYIQELFEKGDKY